MGTVLYGQVDPAGFRPRICDTVGSYRARSLGRRVDAQDRGGVASCRGSLCGHLAVVCAVRRRAQPSQLVFDRSTSVPRAAVVLHETTTPSAVNGSPLFNGISLPPPFFWRVGTF